MIINGKEVAIEELIGNEDLHNNLGKLRNNNLYLSDYQISVLERNQISYQNINSMKELSFKIEEILNDEDTLDPELEEVSRQIDEYRYYHEIHH